MKQFNQRSETLTPGSPIRAIRGHSAFWDREKRGREGLEGFCQFSERGGASPKGDVVSKWPFRPNLTASAQKCLRFVGSLVALLRSLFFF